MYVILLVCTSLCLWSTCTDTADVSDDVTPNVPPLGPDFDQINGTSMMTCVRQSLDSDLDLTTVIWCRDLQACYLHSGEKNLAEVGRGYGCLCFAPETAEYADYSYYEN